RCRDLPRPGLGLAITGTRSSGGVTSRGTHEPIAMSSPARKQQEASHSNFIRQIVEADLMAGKYAKRRWGGRPGSALSAEHAAIDTAKIRTRFPPEPNGYLHFGH